MRCDPQFHRARAYVEPPIAAFAAASLVVLLAGPLLAQNEVRATSATPVDTMADVLVLDQNYVGAEYVRVFLESGQVYRAELSSRDITLQIRAVGDRFRAPRPYPILGPESASEASVVELYPDRDGDYEIRAIALNGVAVATHLRLYRDVAESHRRMAVMNKPGWEIGMELAGGWHSGFPQTSILSTGNPDPHAGTDIEACFTARTETGRGGLCAVGIGYQSQVGDRSILWFYTEPRLMLVGHRSKRASTWEAGALFRAGLGSVERMSGTPVILAPGVYISRQIRSSEHGARWSLKGSYSHAWYSGFRSPTGTTAQQPDGDRLTLGLGWYK